MMKLLRNTEVLKGISVYIIISVIAVSKAFSMGSHFGAFTATLCLLFIIIHIFTTWKRYRKINDLAADIDSILHGDNHIELNSYDEGELALLQSEIYKMTVCLREQGQKLISDKVYLADSIADISHQIRTPLTSINLLVQLLSKPNLDEERRCQLCLELRQMLSRIDWLITSLLKISKLDAGTIIFNQEKFTLEELINKSCAPLLVSI
ncbi:MAG: sensor histidine kinase, partial [Ruminococcus flavefaciens]|nr:sensor histidine kinase [Ruminococcus flavefaciens]